MLYALGHPVALAALVIGFLVGVLARGVVQARLAARLGDRSAIAAGRGRFDVRRHLDPFGAVAAGIAGVGWGHPVERPYLVRRSQRSRIAAVLLAGPVTLLVLGIAAIVGYRLAGGPDISVSGVTTSVVHGDLGGSIVPAGQVMLATAGVELLAMGVLALVPLPPLDGGRLLFLYGGQTPGWQKAEYWLVEQNIGIVALLVLLLLPLGGGGAPLLLMIVDLVVNPILGGLL